MTEFLRRQLAGSPSPQRQSLGGRLGQSLGGRLARVWSTGRRALGLSGVLLLLGGLGCRPADLPAVDDPARVVDLIDWFDSADRGTLRSRWRLADPEFAARRLTGWDAPESDASGAFVWALGDRASLDLRLDRRRPVELRLRCRGWSPAARSTVTLEVAGQTIGSGSLAGLEEVEFRGRLDAAPASVPTHLELRFAEPRDPSVSDGLDDARPLAARCSTLSVEAVDEASDSAHRSRGGDPRRVEDRLELPAGAWVRWDLDLPAGAVLERGAVDAPRGLALWRRLVIDSADGPRVGTEWTPVGSSPERLLEATDTQRWVRLEYLVAVEGSAGEAPSSRASIDPEAVVTLDALRRVDLGPTAAANPSVEAPLAGSSAAGAAEPPEPRRANVLLYVVDTLRADRLGVYRDPSPTPQPDLTPALDRFAADAIVFEDARAQTSWTRPAVVSILTGRLPGAHGVEDRDDALAPSVTTLAERLVTAGWTTGALITNGNVGPGVGLGQGFESYRHLPESSTRETYHLPAVRLHERALEWLDGWRALEGDAPFLLYVHATDPHAPYTPSPGAREAFASTVDPALGELDSLRPLVTGERPPAPGEAAAIAALYDAEVADFDAAFGAFWQALRERELDRNTIVVFVSDHGEEFFEHGGWEHGRTLYEEQLRVPLILRLPSEWTRPTDRLAADPQAADPQTAAPQAAVPPSAGVRVAGVADQIDILPTLLDLLGLAPEPGLDGRSLRSAWEQENPARPSIAELRLEGSDGASLIDGSFKVIEGLGARRAFDLGADPGEQVDQETSESIRAGVVAQRLRRLRAEAASRRPAATAASIDPETRKRLEALGYAQ